MKRDNFSTRLGFILVSAGCAIGLGNVWRFPYIAGEYGGAVFVFIYLLFLAILGLPIMTAEFAVGRGSQRSPAMNFDALEPRGTKWHWHKYTSIAGNLILMMFYTTVSGWMLYYLYKMALGDLVGLDADGVGKTFGALLQDPVTLAGNMMAVVLLGGCVCYLGVRQGVERITKWMMTCLILLMVALAINSLLLPGSDKGLAYYLLPDLERFFEQGPDVVIFAAMGQAFFSLSIGIGSLAIFGSYIGKEKRLMGEAAWVIALDTFVALMAGLIIFPACFSFGVNPDSGPNLLFVTLPNVFSEMSGGRLWGSLFFLFMVFASMSTVIAVFENLIASFTELWGADRKKIILWGAPLIVLLSMPCVLGFNLWSDIHPLGEGTIILDLEDFLVSNNLLPLGSLVYLAFCTSRYGWGWEKFLREVDTGEGSAFPRWRWLRFYLTYLLPLIVLGIFFRGYYSLFFAR
ncbi:MAG: sodium-dependent transporter [Selenomonadaceae bacterium]|nr:sodium-dependent transporter [Selenomonadaceae bacterium]